MGKITGTATSGNAFGIYLTGSTNSTAENIIDITKSQITIEGISENGNGYGIYNSSTSTGSIIIYGVNIKGESKADDSNGLAYGICNQGALTVTVVGDNTYNTKIKADGKGKGTETGTGTGIYTNRGILLLNNTESTTTSINKSWPEIKGSHYGVNAKGATFQFHDGKVIGQIAFPKDTIPTLIEGTEVLTTTSDLDSLQTVIINKK